MPSVNPGPATTQTPNAMLQTVPVNTLQNPVPIGANDQRLLAVARGVSLAATGDVAVMPVINATSFSVSNIVVTNSQVNGVGASIATASVGVFTAAAGGGTAIKAQAALASNTAQTVVFQATVASTALILPGTTQSLYLNCGTALAGATADFFIYGYDLS
jgi:hypothetical protein